MSASTSEVGRGLRMTPEKLFTWFQNSCMEANPDKLVFYLAIITDIKINA